MKKNIRFKFTPNQKVKTLFGDVGVVMLCGIDDSPFQKFFVQISTNCQWFNDEQLTAI